MQILLKRKMRKRAQEENGEPNKNSEVAIKESRESYKLQWRNERVEDVVKGFLLQNFFGHIKQTRGKKGNFY